VSNRRGPLNEDIKPRKNIFKLLKIMRKILEIDGDAINLYKIFET
jgi:hypothetical protein